MTIVINNRYEEHWAYMREHGDPDFEEPEYDKTKFGHGVIHELDYGGLFNLYNEAAHLDLRDSFYDWIWTEVELVPHEDHLELHIYERYSE